MALLSGDGVHEGSRYFYFYFYFCFHFHMDRKMPVMCGKVV